MTLHRARHQQQHLGGRLASHLGLERLDWGLALMLVVVPLGIAALLGLGRVPIAFALLAALCGGAFGVVIVRHATLETILGWSMLPVVLLFPPSRGNLGGLPPINSLRAFLVMALLGLLFLNRPDRAAPKASWFTWIYRAVVVAVLLITFLSAAFVNNPVNDPLADWATGPLLILAAGIFATFVGSPGTLLERLSQAARPLAFLLMGIAVFEYVQSGSLYGLEMRVRGFDRRVPGPFYSAEVFGYFFSVLAAFVLYHFRRAKNSFDRGVDLLALAACVIGCALTFFRSSWISLAVVFAADAITHLPPRAWWRRYAANLIVIAPLVLVALIGVVFAASSGIIQGPLIDAINERLNGDAAQNSASNRNSFAQAAWLMIQSNPWTGSGLYQYPIQLLRGRFIPTDLEPEQFAVIFQNFTGSNLNGNVAHNSFIQLTAEVGIPAAALFAVMTILPLAGLVRFYTLRREQFALAATLTAGLLASYLSQSMFYYGPAALIWSGLAFGALIRLGERHEDDVQMVESEL